MAKILELNLEDEDEICRIGSALSSPARIQILKLLYFKSYNVKEIADELKIPASSAALYVRSLEEAGLINTSVQLGSRGSMKICSRKNDNVIIRMTVDDPNVHRVVTTSMPIGHYTDCSVYPTCGIASEISPIGPDDSPETFYYPERVNAQILWTSKGYVEYKFPYQLQDGIEVKRLILTFEACSETSNYNENWISDITIWINGLDCGTWRCPSDFGSRRGKLNPDWWGRGSTQYGRLVTLEVTDSESLINTIHSSSTCLRDFAFSSNDAIAIRIGNKPDAEFAGGINIFGEKFGDYAQDIILSLIY